MKLIGEEINRELCEEMQFACFYRLLYRMRLDLDTETVYHTGNYFLIATVCCQNKRHSFVAVLTCDICQGQILITPTVMRLNAVSIRPAG